MSYRILLSCVGLAGILFWCTSEPQEKSRLESRLQPRMAAPQVAGYGRVPLAFEKNAGQSDSQVEFLSRGDGYNLFLTRREAVLSLHRKDRQAVVRMQFVGANTQPKIRGLDRQSGVSNYLIGNDPSKWQRNVANYGKVEYGAVWPGIDIVYYGNQRNLEYDFVVAPGGDPGQIRMKMAGATKLRLASDGSLLVDVQGGTLTAHAPVVYQRTSLGQKRVAGRYTLDSQSEVGFAVENYDRANTLVIDPILSYSTYLGGSGDDIGTGIAVDAAGAAYVVGYTNSPNFPLANPFQSAQFGGVDAFVTKINAAGSALVYSTYLGGSNLDRGNAIAVDASGDAYITGATSSPNFPRVGSIASMQNSLRGTTNAFVTVLNPSGTPTFSTYFGGSQTDSGNAIAVDAAKNIYIAGSTTSSDFPLMNAILFEGGMGNGDAFIAKIATSNSSLVYSTLLGGSAADSAEGIALDASANAYVTGVTSSTDFPQISPLQSLYGGGTSDAFLTKINAAGNGYVYSTFIGGSGADDGMAVTVDGSGNAYVAGSTASGNFPLVNPLQSTFSSKAGFASKVGPSGSSLVYSTYLGNDLAAAIKVDASGNAYVAGSTSGTTLPLASPIQSTSGILNTFITVLSTAGNTTPFSTLLGGSKQQRALGLALDTNKNIYVTGFTNSSDFPLQNPIQSTYGGGSAGAIPVGDAFVVKILNTQATLATTAGTPQSTFTGTAFPTALQVTVRDGSNAPIPGVTVTFTAPFTSGPTGTFAGGSFTATANTNASGVATAPVFTANSSAGAFVVNATVPGIGTVGAFNLTNTAAPASITATAGTPQTVRINTVLPVALQATVQDSSNSPVSGVSVTFTAPASSGTFAGGALTATMTTNGSGVATAPAFTSGTALGAFVITATGAGVPGTATYTINVTPGLPATLTATSGSGQSATLNTAFANPLVLVARDAGGNLVPAANITFTGPLNSGPGERFSSNGTNVATVPTNSSGVATSPTLAAVNAAGTYTVVATAPGSPAAPISFALTNTNRIVTSITLTASPNPSNLSQPVTLTATVSPDTSGKVSFFSGTTPLGTAFLDESGVTATLTTRLLPSGTALLRAIYIGDASHSPSTSGTFSQTVNALQASGFAPAANLPVGTSPTAIAVGDFNGDGVPDLAIANTNSNNVTVLLGNVSGGFSPAPGSPFAVGSGPTAVVVADFNTDGKQDLAVLNQSSITLLLGNGSGGFAPAPGSPFNNNGAVLMAAGDFNGDGFPDLALVNPSGNVVVLLGDGAGGLSLLDQNTFGGPNPIGIAVGDFNGDGVADLAIANATMAGTVTVLLGNGAGVFAPAPNGPFGAGTFPLSVAVGDLNGDGKLDLAVANSQGGNVTVLLGNGTGGFTAAPGSPFAFASLIGSRSITIGDFNGDGILDLAIANQAGTITVLLGTGTGAYTEAPGSPFSVGAGPVSVVASDFNGDGKTDLASANSASNNVSVLLAIGPPAAVTAIAGTPQAAMLNTAFPTAFKVTVRDSNNNLLSGVPVTFTAPPPTAGASGTFPGSLSTVTVLTDASGVATAPAFTANSTLGTYTVNANVPGVDTSATFSVTNTAGAPAAVTAVSGGGQSALVTTAFGNPLVVVLRDTFGNPVPNAIITFTAPASGVSAIFAGGTGNSAMAQTNASGIAMSPALTANSIAGGPYSVIASTANAVPASFALTNLAATTPITLQTSPTGLQVSVDGGPLQVAPVTLALSMGPHTISTQSPQTVGNTQYVFTSWSDGGAISHTITVTSTGATYTAVFNPLLSITTAALPAGVLNAPYLTTTVQAQGGFGSYTFTATGLPTGLLLSPGGVLSGTPTAGGTFTPVVAVTDSAVPAQTAQRTFSISIAAGLTITTPCPLPSAVLGSPFSLTITAAGGTGAYTFTSGPLPAGLSISPGGIISGTPTAAGTFPITVTVADSGVGPLRQTASFSCNLTVASTLTITTACPLPSAVLGSPFSLTITAAGGTGAYTFTSGVLPAGLSISPAGIISGTPTAAGTFPITITVTDSGVGQLRQTASFSCNLTVASTLTITTACPLPSALLGSQFSLTIAAAGGTGTYTFASGPLPAGLSINASTGVISGTPSAAGTFPITVTVADSGIGALRQTASFSCNLTVVSTLTITTACPLPSAVLGAPFSLTIAAAGGTGTYTFASGPLPAGLSINASTGVISGTPSVAGTLPITITVADSGVGALRQTASFACNLTVVSRLTITSACPATSGVQGLPYSFPLTAVGGTGSLTWTLTSGPLPTGLTLNTSTGAISGTPTVPGTYPITVTVADASMSYTSNLSQNASYSCNIVIAPVLTITTLCPLPNAVLGTAFSLPMTASGGIGPYSWTSGTLPPGLSINASTGVISGTPTAAGSYSISVTVADAGVGSGQQRNTFTCNLVVVSRLTITSTCPTGGAIQGTPFTFTFAAAGGTNNFTFAFTSALPPGLTFNAATGTLSGTPTTPGTYPVSVSVSDTNTLAAQQTASFSSCNLVVYPILTVTTVCPIAVQTGMQASAFTLNATGGTGTYAFSIIGSLPANLALNGNIAGGLVSASPGNYPFTIQAVSGAQTVQKPCSVTIGAARLQITSACPASPVTQGVAANLPLLSSGGTGQVSWSIVSGALPIGLSVSGSAITGTPTGPPGTFNFVIEAQTADEVATLSCSLTVAGPRLQITSVCPTNGVQNAPYGPFPLTAIGSLGSVGYTFALTQGSLPNGVSINGNAISGTPTVSGPFSFTVGVTSGTQTVSGNSCSIVIAPPALQLTGVCPANPVLSGAPISITASATGGKSPYIFSFVAPPWLTSAGTATGATLSGTAGDPGTYTASITVNDSAQSPSASFSCPLIVSALPPLQLTGTCPASPVAPNAAINASFGAQGGKSPYTFMVTGLAGLSLSTVTGSSTNLTGAAPATPGNYAFTISLQDSSGAAPATLNCPVAVQLAPLQITGTCPAATLSLPVNLSIPLGGSGGQPPYSWTFSGPAFLGLSPNTGPSTTVTSTGQPSNSGPFSFTVTLNDGANSQPATLACSSTVQAPPIPTITIGGLTTPTNLFQPTFISLQLAAPAPVMLTGIVQLSFIPNAFGLTDNPQVVFEGRDASVTGRQFAFTIAPGQTTITLPALQPGTVAGTIRLEIIQLMDGTRDVLPTPHPVGAIVIPQLAPVVAALDVTFANETDAGFDVVISGYATPRDVKTVTLSFTAATGATLDGTTSFTVDVSGLFSQFYSSPASQLTGSMFTNFHIPVIITGDKTAIGAVTVSITNSVGAATPITKTR